MSTRSNIYLLLKPSKRERKVKFDINKLPKSKRATCVLNYPIKDVTIPNNATYMGVYHHWDGYIDGLGEELLKHYKSYKRVLNLLTMGDLSTILRDVKSYQGCNNEDCVPRFGIENTLTPENACREEYAYLFDGKKWWVSSLEYDEVTDKCFITEWRELAPEVKIAVAKHKEWVKQYRAKHKQERKENK